MKCKSTIVDRTLRMSRSGKDEALLVLENFEPARQIARVIRPRLQFRDDAEVGRQKAATQIGDQLFVRSEGAILVIAGEIAIKPLFRADPMNIMPISA